MDTPEISPDLLAKYDRPGPRYTSYPPAPIWRSDFGAAEYEATLAAANAATGPLSLYVHLPFCEQMCRYCGCNVIGTKDHGRADAYLDVLEREVARVAERLPSRRVVSQLHWGGGTPTFLSSAQLSRCHALLARHFEIAADAEVAVEVDPAVTTEEQLATLASLGFNRVSMGVQDFDPMVQAAVAREQGVAETAELISAARRLGFRSVNVDIMYGLPRQTLRSWARTLNQVLELSPDRLAVFGYAHVPWAKPHQRLLPESALPGPQLRMALFRAAAGALSDAGYRQIGLDHFCRETDELAKAQARGALHRNFQGYSPRAASDSIGFGVSSISFVAGAYAQNAHRLKDWEGPLRAGSLPIERGLRLSPDDKLRQHAIDQLMCNFALDLRPLDELFGAGSRDSLAPAVRALEEAERDGLVELTAERVRVTPLGRLLLRNVALAFDAHLADANAQGFSRTV